MPEIVPVTLRPQCVRRLILIVAFQHVRHLDANMESTLNVDKDKSYFLAKEERSTCLEREEMDGNSIVVDTRPHAQW